jgi:hypothetical protein
LLLRRISSGARRAARASLSCPRLSSLASRPWTLDLGLFNSAFRVPNSAFGKFRVKTLCCSGGLQPPILSPPISPSGMTNSLAFSTPGSHPKNKTESCRDDLLSATGYHETSARGDLCCITLRDNGGHLYEDSAISLHGGNKGRRKSTDRTEVSRDATRARTQRLAETSTFAWES